MRAGSGFGATARYSYPLPAIRATPSATKDGWRDSALGHGDSGRIAGLGYIPTTGIQRSQTLYLSNSSR